MKLIIKLGKLLFVLLLLQSCTAEKKEISLIKEMDQEQEMISSYKEGMIALEKGDTFYAAQKFLEAELLYPQSEWASKSALMASYAYYLQDYFSKSLFNLERFLISPFLLIPTSKIPYLSSTLKLDKLIGTPK